MLQKSTVEKETLGLLKELQSRPLLDSFLLVGGTVLILPRISFPFPPEFGRIKAYFVC